MRKFSEIDLTKSRRRYYSDKCNLKHCPECSSGLKEEKCTILISATSETDQGEFMTNLSGSHFCEKCPVVVFDVDQVAKAVKLGIRGEENLTYYISGIIDLDSIPEDKRHLEIGSDQNPVPLVKFLPDINKPGITVKKKPGRNDPCTCGSGIKYKKCCGKNGN